MSLMLKKEFIQKRGTNYRKFLLYNDRVIVELKTLKKINKYEIRLEDLGFNKLYQADNTKPGKITSGIFFLIPFIVLIVSIVKHDIDIFFLVYISVMFFILAALIYFKQGQDDIYLTGGKQNLVFYRMIPNEPVVLKFIDEVILTTKEYLKDKYARFDDYTLEQSYINGLIYLKNQEIITSQEFQEFIDDYKTSRLL